MVTPQGPGEVSAFGTADDRTGVTVDLEWARLRLVLENVRNTHGRAHPLFVLRAILLNAWGRTLPEAERPGGWFFRLAGPVGARVRLGARYVVWVVLPPGIEMAALATRLGASTAAWLEEGGDRRNFRLSEPPVVETVTLSRLMSEPERPDQNSSAAPADSPLADEWALDFLTPLALREGNRSHLNGERLARLLEGRLNPLGFGATTAAARAVLMAPDGVSVRPWFLEWSRWGHSFKDGPERAPSREDLAGLSGSLFLRGAAPRLAALRPALRLAEEFGLGKGLHRGQGACRLRLEAPAYFDVQIGNHTAYFAAFDDVRGEAEADPVLHASERGGRSAASLHSLHDRESWCRELAAEMRAGTYRPEPPRLLSIAKSDGGTRMLTLLHDRDRVAQRTLLRLVAPVLDRQLEESSHAWRAGRGVETARVLVAAAFRDGFTWVVESDIAAFYDEIPQAGMDDALRRALPLGDVRTFSALRACYAGALESATEKRAELPVIDTAGGPAAPATSRRGLHQGSPLSPLLANVYLDGFDEAMADPDRRLVRYGDDFLILCRSREAAAKALEAARTRLEAMGLRLREDKTALTSFQAGFSFLGREFGAGMDEAAAEAATLRRTIFIHTPGAWAGQDHDSIAVKKDHALLARIPLARVSDIIFFGAQGVSTWLLHTCARRRIPVTLATASGWHVQTLAPDSRAQWDLAARQAARHGRLGPEGLTAQARLIVEAKLANHLAWLRSLPGGALADASRAAAAAALHQALAALPTATSVEALRGLEGAAAAALYPVVNCLSIDPAFHSTHRRPREKHDLWNTLYDAGSSLLFSRLNLLLRSRGINPYLGFLHSAADPYESFVCDLQEPFRARLDRFLLKTVNKRTLTPLHFEENTSAAGSSADTAQGQVPPAAGRRDSPWKKGRYRLSHDGHRRLLDAWDRELRIRLAGDPAPLGELLASQIWLTQEYIQRHLPFLKLYRSAHADTEP
jgi:CRISPR-associated endonuclease Cas1